MTPRFDILSTPIPGLQVLHRKPLGDHRGYLERMYCVEELHCILRGKAILQINHTLTAKLGTVRGMHYQRPPPEEMKFVTCLRGEVFDVAIDLRQNSPTYLHWHAELLSPENHRTLLIPAGFAHGFQALTHGCEMLYFHTAMYTPRSEYGLNPVDPRLAIQWPHEIVEMSARDASHQMLTDAFVGVQL